MNSECENMDLKQKNSIMRNVEGTLAIEGISISQSTRRNLDRIVSGDISYQQILCGLKAKYSNRG